MNETGEVAWYTIGWAVWILAFFAIELPAIRNKRDGDTLTEHVRRWFALRDKPTGWRMRRFALAAFLLWLATHFFLGW